MANVVAFFTLYLITIALYPEKGTDLATAIVNIAKVLTDTNGVKFVYRFKVIGEPKIIVIVEVTKPVSLERILGILSRLATLDIESQPVIAIRDFARNLGVSEELIRRPGRILRNKGLFLFKFTVDYYGNTTDEYLAARKASLEFTLSRILPGGERPGLNWYKELAGRTQSMFININDTVSWDRETLTIPLARQFGSNARFSDTKGLQFLEVYTADVANEKSDY
ncbi:hypothetical protein BsWGS_10332 [Bradybaena similaris]